MHLSGFPRPALGDGRRLDFAPCVEILDYAGQIDTEETGMMVAEVLKDRAALLLRGHASVVVGSDPEEACCNAFELELIAKIQFQVLLLGTPRAVTREEIQNSSQPRNPRYPPPAWLRSLFTRERVGCRCRLGR